MTPDEALAKVDGWRSALNEMGATALGYNDVLAAEVRRLRAVVQLLVDQRERIEGIAEDHPDGTPERRLCDDLLDAIAAAAAQEANRDG